MESNLLHPVHDNNKGLFNTVSGKQIDIMQPDPYDFDIEDIANHLSKICRFGGMINQFYSVAQHSVMVSRIAARKINPLFAREALMHDASEAYLGDVIKPLKNILGRAYEDIEERFMRTIFYRYQLNYEVLSLIKEADKDALELEHYAFKEGLYYGYYGEAALLELPETSLDPYAAERLFIKEAHALKLVL